MGNTVGQAYGLTALIPITNGTENNRSYDKIIRDKLQAWPVDRQSPLAKVPNTYLARLYLLADVFYEGAPARDEHLKSTYLVFSSNFHGDLDTYLVGMWNALDTLLPDFLRYCVAFDSVRSAEQFVEYIKRCQIDNSLFFCGSNDKPLAEQLKALYVKQAFIHFAHRAQRFRYEGVGGAARLQAAFTRFAAFIDVDNVDTPTWPVGAHTLPDVEARVQALFDGMPEAGS